MQIHISILILTCLLAPTLQLHALQSGAQTKLPISSGQFIESSTGRYRLSLLSNCTILIQQFGQTGQYQNFNTINPPPSVNTQPCRFLQLNTENGQLINNKGGIYALLISQNMQIDQLLFFLTEFGEPRLQGSQIINGENVVQLGQFPNYRPVVTPNSGLNNRIFTILPRGRTVTNSNGWNFIFNDNNMEISKGNITKILQYRGITITPQTILDQQGESRYALLPGMTLHPRAANNDQCYSSAFDNSYFYIDDFFPVMRVIDRRGYQVAEFGLNEPKGYPTRFCPPKTFRHQNNCLSACPSPFYHEIREQHGRCVLACEAGSSVDALNRICYSVNYPYVNISQITCGPQSVKQKLGCYCTNQGQFYNHLSNQCEPECPRGHLAYTANRVDLDHWGICVLCPLNCQSCSVDSQRKSQITCTQCISGYQLNSYGECISACSVQNCAECDPNNIRVCRHCNSFYALVGDICISQCFSGSLPILGPNAQLVCEPITVASHRSSPQKYYMGAMHQGKVYTFIKECPNGQLIFGKQCVNSCPGGFKKSNNLCVCNEAGQYYVGGKCISLPLTPSGMYFDDKYQTYFNCPISCLSCNQDRCLSCSTGYILMITEKGNTFCQKNSPFFFCDPQFYRYDSQVGTCSALSNVGNCQSLSHCSVCSNGICLSCNAGYSLLNGVCTQCSQQNSYRGICYQVPNCQNLNIQSNSNHIPISASAVSSQQIFKEYTDGGYAISKDPVLQSLFIRNQLFIENPTSQTFYSSLQNIKASCSVCSQGFTLQNGQCTKRGGRCPMEKVFYFQNNCYASCPIQTYPQADPNSNLTMICIPEAEAETKDFLRLDGSVYTYNDSHYLYYFITDQVLANDTVQVKVQSTRLKVSQGTGLVLPGEEKGFTGFKNRTYISVLRSADEVALDFRQDIAGLRTTAGSYLGEGIYGVRKGYSHLDYQQGWLAIIGYVLSLLIIIVHCIYIGNYLIYKVDNLLIFAQSIWYFAFINLFIGNPLSQFYWGFSWAHWKFYPNYFEGTIPKGYYQGFSPASSESEYNLPNSYRLATGDANFIRNAGFSFSLLLTFIGAYLIVVLVIFILKKVCHKTEVWYYKIARDALLAAIQFVSFNIFYWAVAHLMYNDNKFSPQYLNQPETHVTFRTSCSIAAIVFIAVLALYMIIRAYFNKLGGLYMLKRLVYAAILASSAHKYLSFLGEDSIVSITSRQLLVIALVVFQLIFIALRFALEKPKLKRHKIFIITEGILMIACFIIMYFVKNVAVVAIIVSLFIIAFWIFLVQDLIDVRNDAKDQYFEEEVGIVKGAMQKIPDTERM